MSDSNSTAVKFCNKCQCETARDSSSRCKQCRAKYRSDNKESIRAYQLKWNAENAAHVKAYRKQDYAENKEKHNTRSNEWKRVNYDHVKAYRYSSYAENADYYRKKAKDWREVNPTLVRQYWENRRALKKKSEGVLSTKIREKLFTLQRGKCACCGLHLGDNYHLDHIMPLALGGSNTDCNVQLLTASCNHRKCAKHPIDFMQERGFLL